MFSFSFGDFDCAVATLEKYPTAIPLAAAVAVS
jgi:hypothetical protein